MGILRSFSTQQTRLVTCVEQATLRKLEKNNCASLSKLDHLAN